MSEIGNFRETKGGLAICPFFTWTSENVEGLGYSETDVNLVHCTHPNNKEDYEGNCTEKLCPLVAALNAQQPCGTCGGSGEVIVETVDLDGRNLKKACPACQPAATGELVRLLEKVREDIAEDKGFDILTDKCANPDGCSVCLLTKALALHKRAAARIEALEKANRWIPTDEPPEILGANIPPKAWEVSYHVLEYEAKIPTVMTAAQIWLDEGSEVEWYKPIVLPEAALIAKEQENGKD